MQAGFFKRVCAYIIDILIVYAIMSLVTMSVNTNNDYQEKLSELTEKYSATEVTYEDFIVEYNELNYKTQKSSYINYVVEFILTVGYFVVFQTLNKGQTLGKKILKLRVVNNNEGDINFKNIIIRSIFLYSILPLITTVFTIKFLNMKTYINVYSVVTTIEAVFFFLTFGFIVYRKDKRGLHDIIANTKVISE